MKRQTWLKGAVIVVIAALVLSGCSKRAEAQEGGSGGGSRSSVRESPVSDFSYGMTDDGRGIRITGYTGNGGNVVIPSTIENMPVLEIGRTAFEGRNAITSTVIPDSVEIIRLGAFRNLTGLTRINLPTSLKEIWSEAFRNCGELTDLIIPDSLTEIAFMRNFNGTISQNNSNQFSGCQKLPLRTRQRLQELGYSNNF